MARIDWISKLPEELLLRILSLLPARDVVATMVLSKRWQFLWMNVSRLVYDDTYQGIEHKSFSRFVERSLLLHEAPVLELLHFKLRKSSSVVDIGLWTRSLSRRHVSKLVIKIDSSSCTEPPILPRSLYTACGMLVTLKLNNTVLADFDSSSFSFPSLKTLSLVSVEYPNQEFVDSLLSRCHVLEDLDVEQCQDDNVTVFNVRVPSLKSLVLDKSETSDTSGEDVYVIDAPSLEYLDIYDLSGGSCVIENNMPSIVDALLYVSYEHPVNILGFITSVKRLNLCLPTSKQLYPVSTVFHRLVRLELCTCEKSWLKVLMRMLRVSPNLQSLKLQKFHDIDFDDSPRPRWREPGTVPQCLSSSLETLEWVRYEGTKEERELVAFILRNAKCLGNVTISLKSTKRNKKKLAMIKELSFLSRCSSTCHLIFDEVAPSDSER